MCSLSSGRVLHLIIRKFIYQYGGNNHGKNYLFDLPGGGDSTPGVVWRHVSKTGGGDIIIMKRAVDIWERVQGVQFPLAPLIKEKLLTYSLH